MSDLVRELNAAIDDPTKGLAELRWHCAQAADKIEALEVAGRNLVDAWFGDENIEPLIHELRAALKQD